MGTYEMCTPEVEATPAPPAATGAAVCASGRRVHLNQKLCVDEGALIEGRGWNKGDLDGCYNFCMATPGCRYISLSSSGWCNRYSDCTPRSESHAAYTTYEMCTPNELISGTVIRSPSTWLFFTAITACIFSWHICS